MNVQQRGNSDSLSNEQQQQQQQQKQPSRRKPKLRRNRSQIFEPQHRLANDEHGFYTSVSTGNLSSLQQQLLRNAKKSVSFDRIEILEFPIAIGDNPCVSSGVPIQIAWEPKGRNTWAVDGYELHRLREGKRGKRNRSEKSLCIPAEERQQWLKDSSLYTPEELSKASRAAKLTKERRERSVRLQSWDGLFWAVEKTGRRLRKVASLASLTRGGGSSSKSPSIMKVVATTKTLPASPISSPSSSSSSKQRPLETRSSSDLPESCTPTVDIVPSMATDLERKSFNNHSTNNLGEDDTPSTVTSSTASKGMLDDEEIDYSSEGPLMF